MTRHSFPFLLSNTQSSLRLLSHDQFDYGGGHLSNIEKNPWGTAIQMKRQSFLFFISNTLFQ